MDEHDVGAALLQRELPDRLQKRQPLDVAHRPADLGDENVDVVLRARDPRLDLVRDVRNHLHRAAQIVPAPLLADHGVVDLAGRVVAGAGEMRVREALVVAQIQVGLRPVVGDVDLAVLVGGHRPRVDVDVGVELLDADAQAARLQQGPDGGRGEPLAEAGDHAACYEDVLPHVIDRAVSLKPTILARRTSASLARAHPRARQRFRNAA
jgi:hypothetical protein